MKDKIVIEGSASGDVEVGAEDVSITFQHAAFGIKVVGMPVGGYSPDNVLSEAISKQIVKQGHKEAQAAMGILKLENPDPTGSFPSTGPSFEVSEPQSSSHIMDTLKRWAELVNAGSVEPRIQVSDELAEHILKETGKDVRGLFLTSWDMSESILNGAHVVNIKLDL